MHQLGSWGQRVLSMALVQVEAWFGSGWRRRADLRDWGHWFYRASILLANTAGACLMVATASSYEAPPTHTHIYTCSVAFWTINWVTPFSPSEICVLSPNKEKVNCPGSQLGGSRLELWELESAMIWAVPTVWEDGPVPIEAEWNILHSFEVMALISEQGCILVAVFLLISFFLPETLGRYQH